MVLHLVLLKPRADLSTGDREAFVTAFRNAVTAIPSVRRCRVGRRITHGAGYEKAMTDAADAMFMAALEFDDLAGLQTYLRHPAHAELGARFGQIASGTDPEGSPGAAWSWVFDFEAGGLEGLEGLI
jgi:hypothetical protein